MKKNIFNLSFLCVSFLVKTKLAYAADPITLDKLLPVKIKTTIDDMLPSGDFASVFVPNIIKYILTVAGTLVLLALLVAGTMMVTARGDDETLKKAKNIITYCVLGLLIIATSYAILFGIAQLTFF